MTFKQWWGKWWGKFWHRCAIHYEEKKDLALREMYKTDPHAPVCNWCVALALFDDMGRKLFGPKYDEEMSAFKKARDGLRVDTARP